MTNLADLSDAELATRRFNQKERFRLLQDGMPIEAIRMLRSLYVDAVLKNPEALRGIKAEFGITEPAEMVQVLMTPAVFEEFKRWLARSGASVFPVPGMPEGELPTYGVSR